jgi:hypothetical protein
MTPTNWTGLIAICTVLGMIGASLVFGGKMVVHFTRMTDAVEKGGDTMDRFGQTLDRMEHGMGKILDKVLDHDDRFTQTSERLDKLEEIVMTADQQAEGIVGHVMMIGKTRRRRGQS